MSAIAEILGTEIEAILERAIDKKAQEIAGAKLYSGSAAIESFGITRSSLKHIIATYLPGRSKPMYSAAAITTYIELKSPKKSKEIKKRGGDR